MRSRAIVWRFRRQACAMLRRLLILLALLLLLAGGVAGGAAWWGWRTWQEAGPTGQPVTVVIPRGASLGQIIAALDDAGLFRDDLAREVFGLGVRLEDLAPRFRAGEYAIPPGASLAAVARQFAAGHGLVQHTLTVPEGLTTPAILALVRDHPVLSGGNGPAPPEGALLPETYAVLRGDERAAVIARMRGAQQTALEALWAARAPNLPLKTPQEAVILASVVEKETGLADERPRVAAVFINRLRLGMPLQSDPTVIYGLAPETGNLGRPLLRKDLEIDHPYNTYTRPGLPAGPICNPGRDALAAVLNPPTTRDLYFVADGTGGHAFAETLSEHNRNVARWRRLQRGGP